MLAIFSLRFFFHLVQLPIMKPALGPNVNDGSTHLISVDRSGMMRAVSIYINWCCMTPVVLTSFRTAATSALL